jgi:hypothetical protein
MRTFTVIYFRPHSYFQSKDIQHFLGDTPKQFFVFLGAVKLARMCKDTLSLAAFELLILRTLNTFHQYTKLVTLPLL